MEELPEQIIFKPIGVVHSAFTQEEGTPIQPALANGAPGWVDILPEFGDGLKDLETFERVWLVFCLNKAGPCKLVIKPYLDDTPHGVFATRSPSRPNPLGISCVRVTGREGLRLDIADVDILDGTPLLDIKPYVPKFDIFNVTRVGWVTDVPDSHNADKRFTC